LQDSFEELTATAIPKARDLSGVWYNVVSEMEDNTKDYKEHTKEVLSEGKDSVVNVWKDMAESIRAKWINELSEALQGAKSFKDALKGVWGTIKSQFFDLVAKMITKWTLGFVANILSGGKNLFSGISNIFSDIGKMLTGSKSGSGSGGLFGGLSSSFLGGISKMAGPIGIGLLAAKFLDLKKIGESVSDALSKAIGAVSLESEMLSAV